MAKITLQDLTIETIGDLPEVGKEAPDFNLQNKQRESVSLSDYQGKCLILSIFPKLNTPTCDLGLKMFNQRASELPNTPVLCISQDPIEDLDSHCDAMNFHNIIMLSAANNPQFGKDYGLTITSECVAKGFLARAVFVLNQQHEIIYRELTADLSDEPNYKSVIKAAQHCKE